MFETKIRRYKYCETYPFLNRLIKNFEIENKVINNYR